ncbi:MAG: transcription elongation factor GreA [Lachnospiraceae bacterium]|nr:transcription elongation factor GreA [Lachnospiraceae bacterium]
MRDKLTKSDIRKMEDEIKYRVTELRPKLLDDVKEARSHGDLSENFEYHAAKREKNKNESRIRYLERMIRSAEVIDDSSASDEVGINNTVTVFFEEEGEEEEYKIVTTVRTNSLMGLISIESPLGKALLGKKEGERAEVVTDNGSYHVIIRHIDKTTTDADDEINQY